MDARIIPGTLRHKIRAGEIDSINDSTLILCGNCLTEQPASEFYVAQARAKVARNGTGRGATMSCRTCKSGTNTEWRKERQAILAAAKAKGCLDCGLVDLDHPEIFEFDHVRPGKVKAVSQYLTSGTVDQMLQEIDRCDLVCANCHRIRTARRPHGSRGRDRVALSLECRADA